MATLVPAMYAYGLLGAAFTHSPWPAPALVTFLFYGIIALAEHRQAADAAGGLVWTLTTAQVAALLLGSVAGLAFVAAFRLPRLIDDRLFYSWDSVRARSLSPARGTWDPLLYPWPAATLLGGVTLLAGVYCLLGGLWHGTDAVMTQQQAVWLGIALAIVGGGATIAGLLQTWRTRAPTGLPGRLTVKYLWCLALLLVVPQLAWSAHYTSSPAIRGTVTLAATALLWTLLAWRTVDVFLGQPQQRIRTWTAIAILAAAHVSGWIAAWAATTAAADNDDDDAVGQALAAVAIAAAIWIGIFLCLGRFWTGPAGTITLAAAPAPPHPQKTQQKPERRSKPQPPQPDDDGSESGAATVPVATRTYLFPDDDDAVAPRHRHSGSSGKHMQQQEFLFPSS